MTQVGRVRRSSSWSNLVLLGGDAFVDAIVEELFYHCLLNLCYIFRTYLRAVDNGEVTVMEESLRVMIEETVFTAEECRRTGYWQEGCRWTPSALLFATFLQWRTLLIMFIDGNIDATRALRLFDTAIVFSPDENDMEKGRAAIVKRRDSGKNYDANSAAPHAMEI